MFNKILYLIQKLLEVIPKVISTFFEFRNKRARTKDIKHVEKYDKIIDKIVTKGDVSKINEELGYVGKKNPDVTKILDKKTPEITDTVSDFNDKLWKK